VFVFALQALNIPNLLPTVELLLIIKSIVTASSTTAQKCPTSAKGIGFSKT
jgi:hypothetical protein